MINEYREMSVNAEKYAASTTKSNSFRKFVKVNI